MEALNSELPVQQCEVQEPYASYFLHDGPHQQPLQFCCPAAFSGSNCVVKQLISVSHFPHVSNALWIHHNTLQRFRCNDDVGL